MQAHAPEHVVPGGLPTERLIAWIIVSKFGDYLGSTAKRGSSSGKVSTSTVAHSATGRGAPFGACAAPPGPRSPQVHLMPVIDHMKAHLRGADRIFVDETRAPVLDPGRKVTRSGHFWAVVSDDRGHGGVGPPIVFGHSFGPMAVMPSLRYAPGRGREHPLKFLAGYRGRLPHNVTPASPTTR